MLKTNVLFVDETNNGRSILAEAYFNQGRENGARAFSAGFAPTEELDRHIFSLLRDDDMSAEDYCPKPIDIFLQPYSPRIDLIVGFTPVAGSYKLPIFPNQPSVIHLDVEPVTEREQTVGHKRAVRDCFADVKLAIDRAKASGRLPGMMAA